jgi:hypothetical protein
LTRVGTVTIQRAYYHCSSCRTGQLPYDQASGLGPGQLSNSLAAAGCLLAAQGSFAEASRVLRELLGIGVDDNQLQQAVLQAGGEVLRRQDQAIEEALSHRQPPPSRVQPERLYISTDGATTLTRDGWREVKCGAVYWDDPVEGHQARYTGRIETSESTGKRLWHLACRNGLREAKEVVVIGDGAAWIWNQAALRFSRARQILDWYHASEHVWACANELHGEGTKKAARWARRMLDLLYEHGGRRLLKALWRSRNAYHHPPAALDDLIGYITPNVARMDYPTYRADGLHIGSGPIECTCKRLVGGRLKGPGMRWSVPGADAVLALRTVWLNDEWTDLWETKPLAA